MAGWERLKAFVKEHAHEEDEKGDYLFFDEPPPTAIEAKVRVTIQCPSCRVMADELIDYREFLSKLAAVLPESQLKETAILHESFQGPEGRERYKALVRALLVLDWIDELPPENSLPPFERRP